MLKIKISVNTNSFEFEGDTPFADVRSLIELWFTALNANDAAAQAQIDKLAARLGASNTKLETAVNQTS